MGSATVGTGKAYSTLAAWWAAEKGNSGNIEALCYQGSDLGAVSMTDGTCSSATITAVDAHTGKIGSATGAYTTGAITCTRAGFALTVTGMYLHGTNVQISQSSTATGSPALTVTNCLIHSAVSDGLLTRSLIYVSYAAASLASVTGTVLIKNNVIFLAGTTNPSTCGIYLSSTANGAGRTGTLVANLYNNSINILATYNASCGIGWNCAKTSTGVASLGIDGKNCIVGSNQSDSYYGDSDYHQFTATGTVSVAFTYSADCDGSSLSLYGDGTCQSGADPSFLFADSESDLTPNPLGALYDTGTDAGVATDIVGTSRPQNGFYDIGAFELAVGGGGGGSAGAPYFFVGSN